MILSGSEMETAQVLISSEAARKKSPAVVGDGLNESSLESAFGSEGLFDVLAVLVVGGLVFRRHDEHLAGEAVTIGVESARVARFQFDLYEIIFAVGHSGYFPQFLFSRRVRRNWGFGR